MSGLVEALSELEYSITDPLPVQSIIFLSAGVQDHRDLYDVIDRANELNIPIHTVLFNLEVQEDMQRIQEIARSTGGKNIHFQGVDSLGPVTQWLSLQRTQTQFAFRSTLTSNSDRTVELRTTSKTLDQSTYIVTLQPPIVIIDRPSAADEHVRKAETFDADMTIVQPVSYQVVAHVEWPDGYPRSLTSAQFYKNGMVEGAPLQSPEENNITFSWNLGIYRDEIEKTPVQLQVGVLDELGFEAKSGVVINFVTVIIPPAPKATPRPEPTVVVTSLDPCDEISQESLLGKAKYYLCILKDYAGYFALVLALVAVLLAVVFRRPLADVAGQAVEGVREVIVSLTKPANLGEVGAYLRVVKGEDSLIDKPIPLYINTVTPVGRDMRQSEIVLQADIEQDR